MTSEEIQRMRQEAKDAIGEFPTGELVRELAACVLALADECERVRKRLTVASDYIQDAKRAAGCVAGESVALALWREACEQPKCACGNPCDSTGYCDECLGG